MIRFLTLTALLGVVADADPPPQLDLKKVGDTIAVYREGLEKPLVVQQMPADGRPYLHPLLAPDGKGVLTEFSPGHHKHQTGVYVGILKVNGRDYFHNRDGSYFTRKEHSTKWGNNKAAWSIGYDWLGANKQPLLTETQQWVLTDHGKFYTLDLDWSAKAAVPITVEKYDYGGLFVRMPWTAKTGGEAINAEGKKNGAADTQKSKWVDVGMPIEGRDDEGRIAILDHKDNFGHPIVWRVDGQLGVGPARSRLGTWKMAANETVKAKYRLLVYTGKADPERVEASWADFTK